MSLLRSIPEMCKRGGISGRGAKEEARLHACPSARVSVRGSHQKVSGERQMAIDIATGIKTIKYRDVDYETAKKEVTEYFQGRWEAYPSEIEEDLELDYKLICQIVEELKREGCLVVL